jgi:hypothetical protein
MNRHPLGGIRLRAGASGTLIALALAIITASPALALTWDGEAQLTGRVIYKPEILRTGATSAVAVWLGPDAQLYARRTSNVGVNWTLPVTLGLSNGIVPAASGSGRYVDVAFVRRVVSSTRAVSWPLHYRRSTNGGESWGGAKLLTSSGASVADQDVARHANGQVTVVWAGLYTGNIYIRTSNDYGATFGPATYVGRTLNSESGGRTIYRADPAIAIGDGVTYLAYTSARDTISVRRSLNRGATWSAPVALNVHASGPYSVAASGRWAVVGYTASNTGVPQAYYRRSLNQGTSWSGTRLIQGSGRISLDPQFTTYGGTLGVVYKHGPLRAPIKYREARNLAAVPSNLDAPWSTPTQVSQVHGAAGDATPGGVALLNGAILAGYYQTNSDAPVGYWVRRGYP